MAESCAKYRWWIMFIAMLFILSNAVGMTGNATNTDNRFIDIAMGPDHALALASDGTVWAWGNNCDGACGIEINDTTRTLYTPVQIPGLEAVKAVAAGQFFSLALKDDGTVWAWGNNEHGILGNSREPRDIMRYPEPLPISGLTNITAIDAGQNFAMALRDDGTVWAWGNNGFSQLGEANNDLTPDSLSVFRSNPHVVAGINGVKAISCGPVNPIAIKEDGTVWLWGRSDYILGNRFWSITASDTSTPGMIGSMDNVISAAAGEGHAIFLKGDGTVWTSGDNWRGKLGNGSKNYHTLSGELTCEPIQVPGLRDVIAVDAGIEHSVALMANGTVVAWGGNEMGQIGDGTKDDRNSPVVVPVTNAVAIDAGGLNTAILDANGDIWVSGENVFGQVGNSAYSSQEYVKSPVKVIFNDDVISPTIVPGNNSNNDISTPLSSPQDAGGFNPMLLIIACVVIIILGFFVYMMKK